MFDVNAILMSGGLLLLAAIVYAEVGLLLGFFLPGDTLLLAAGIYAQQGEVSIVAVIAVVAVAAITGDSTGYYFGRRLGPRVFTKPDGVIFRRDYIKKAEKFYAKYGAKSLLVSHFIPIVRTFQPLLAGVGHMPYKKFLLFSTIGDLIWATTLPLLGYYLGSTVPHIDEYILAILLSAIALTLAPTIFHVVRTKIGKKRAKRK